MFKRKVFEELKDWKSKENPEVILSTKVDFNRYENKFIAVFPFTASL